jgi:hypothetical protein
MVMQVWPPERVEALRRVYADDLPLADIARLFDCSKNSILGKIDRLAKAGVLGSPRRAAIARPVERSPALLANIERLTAQGIGKRPIAKALGISKDLVQVIRREIRDAPKPVILAPSPPPTPAPIPRREGGRQCKWLEGDEKPYQRCTAEREPGSSYCRAHSRIAFLRWDQRRTEAVA